MKNFNILIFTILLFSSCSRTKEEEKKLEIVIKSFANNLYTNYHLFSDRERKDNTGKFEGTWPRTMRVDNPHDAAMKRRMKRKAQK